MSNGLQAKPKQSESDYQSFVRELTSGEINPMPEGETWRKKIRRISVPGRIAEIDKETYWHFLEVLPPRFLEGDLFAFAEGMAPLLLFWRRGRRCLCRQLSWGETRKFCRCVGVPQDYWGY